MKIHPDRKFLPVDFKLNSAADVVPYFEQLLEASLSDRASLEHWLVLRNELECVVAEDLGWRYINMTCHTENEDFQKSYAYFIENIQPQLAQYADQLNRKILSCEAVGKVENLPGYQLMIRNLRKEVEIYREENIPLFTEINSLSQKYAQRSAAMTIDHNGTEITLQQAAVLLLENDRSLREQVWRKITQRRLEDASELDQIFSAMVRLRHQVAVNAGFENFRDYMFKAMGRFDYTPKDCFDFHQSIEEYVVPKLNDLAKERKSRLGLNDLRPWDKAVDPSGLPPLKAFEGGDDLTNKSIECFQRLDPFLGQCLSTMKEMGHLDLVSRKGKAPGGYNYPLAETGIPFIFMNATSTLRDLTTIMHEGGHAVHNFLTKDLLLNDFKSPPMEVAELASMSMELISMDQWNIFFNNPGDLVRAKTEQLEDILETLPWVATIDAFQHWIYENPNHSSEERAKKWREILNRFSDVYTDWSGLEEAKDFLWHKQLHLFEVPFYYIEYGMAQLGAIAIWRNYKTNPAKGLQGYFDALKLGYMTAIPEIYSAAGISFDFSGNYIRELTEFTGRELDKAATIN
ncbi:MAG: M3 family oligoendopeptidase [Bacteroidetes bacterium]|nr:M3 family oligoendopeptidase [Bacteroidota bacterium]